MSVLNDKQIAAARLRIGELDGRSDLIDTVRHWQKLCTATISEVSELRGAVKERDARIKELERALSSILELNPANPAAIKVAREMAKQALGRGGDA